MTNVYQASQLLFCLHITLKMPLDKAIENGVQVKLFKIFVHTYRAGFLTVPPLKNQITQQISSKRVLRFRTQNIFTLKKVKTILWKQNWGFLSLGVIYWSENSFIWQKRCYFCGKVVNLNFLLAVLVNESPYEADIAGKRSEPECMSWSPLG